MMIKRTALFVSLSLIAATPSFADIAVNCTVEVSESQNTLECFSGVGAGSGSTAVVTKGPGDGGLLRRIFRKRDRGFDAQVERKTRKSGIRPPKRQGCNVGRT